MLGKNLENNEKQLMLAMLSKTGADDGFFSAQNVKDLVVEAYNKFRGKDTEEHEEKEKSQSKAD